MNNKTAEKPCFVPWTPAQDQFLKMNLEEMTNPELAQALNRTTNAVHYRLKYLKLNRSEASKRRKLSKAYEMVWRKNGRTPNLCKEMAITIRTSKDGNQYKWIKFNGKWELLHRAIWKQEFGEIPAGKLVKIIGNPLAVEWGKTDNLDLVTRAELLELNKEINSPYKARRRKGKWTPVQISFLKENYNHLTNEELAQHLSKSKHAVIQQLNRQGLKRSHSRRSSVAKDRNSFQSIFTPAQDKILMENYQKSSNEALAELTAMKKSQVSRRMKHLGLKRSRKIMPESFKAKISIWTPAQDEILRGNFETHTNDELAALTKMKKTQVIARMKYLQLRRKKRLIGKSSEPRKPKPTTPKQIRKANVMNAFKKEGLSTHGLNQSLKAYINEGVGSIEDLLNKARHQTTNKTALRKREEKKRGRKNRLMFEINPDDPRSREAQLMEFMSSLPVKHISKRRRTA